MPWSDSVICWPIMLHLRTVHEYREKLSEIWSGANVSNENWCSSLRNGATKQKPAGLKCWKTFRHGCAHISSQAPDCPSTVGLAATNDIGAEDQSATCSKVEIALAGGLGATKQKPAGFRYWKIFRHGSVRINYQEYRNGRFT